MEKKINEVIIKGRIIMFYFVFVLKVMQLHPSERWMVFVTFMLNQ